MARQQASERLKGKGMERRPRWLVRTVGLVGVANLAVALGLLLASQAAGRTEGGVASSTNCERHDHAFVLASYAPAFRTYDDPIEDSGSAPDFCASELVTNDNQAITIGIHAHNRSGIAPGDVYSVFLNTDLNANTGGGGVGAEYQITLDGAGAQLKQWDGAGYVATSATPLPMQWVPDYGPVLFLPRTAIANPTGFSFVLVSANGQDSDRAPDAGSWSYSLSPFALKIKSLSVGPALRGRRFTAAALVMRSDFDIPLTEGTIGCAAKLSGRSFAGKGRFARSRATCMWRLPKGAGGNRLGGTVSVTFQGVKAKRSFSVRVR